MDFYIVYHKYNIRSSNCNFEPVLLLTVLYLQQRQQHLFILSHLGIHFLSQYMKIFPIQYTIPTFGYNTLFPSLNTWKYQLSYHIYRIYQQSYTDHFYTGNKELSDANTGHNPMIGKKHSNLHSLF